MDQIGDLWRSSNPRPAPFDREYSASKADINAKLVSRETEEQCAVLHTCSPVSAMISAPVAEHQALATFALSKREPGSDRGIPES